MNFRSGNFNRGMYPNNYPNRDSNNRANHPANNGTNSCAGKDANRPADDLQRGGEMRGAMEPIAGAPNTDAAVNSNPIVTNATAANPTGVPEPPSLTELKRLIQQFGVFLPEAKRQVIEDTVAQLEASGGVQSEEQGRRLLAQLLGALGLQSGAQ